MYVCMFCRYKMLREQHCRLMLIQMVIIFLSPFFCQLESHFYFIYHRPYCNVYEYIKKFWAYYIYLCTYFVIFFFFLFDIYYNKQRNLFINTILIYSSHDFHELNDFIIFFFIINSLIVHPEFFFLYLLQIHKRMYLLKRFLIFSSRNYS